MKINYIISIGIAVVSAIYLVSCNNKETRTEDKPKAHQTSKNAYSDLRKQTFSVTPEMLELSLDNNKAIVYGVVMDWEMGGAIATTISFITGDASLYLSSGGAIIGGGQHENVNQASKNFTTLAQDFLAKSIKTEETSLPGSDEIKFYLLTNKGVYVGKDTISNFENNSSPWMKMFNEGNKLLSELRTVDGGL